MIRRLMCLDYSNYCVQQASVLQHAMEVNYFHLAPPEWSDSSQPETNDRDANALPVALLEAFLCDVGTDTPMVQPAPPCCFVQPKLDEHVERAKQAVIPVNTNIHNSH